MHFRLIIAATLLLCHSAGMAQNLNTTFRHKISYPGQTLANVWGHVADGKEYALVGGAQGLIILDITNPDAPQQIAQIPGPNNLWKEIKTYQNYAYIVSEGGQGIQIVNLAGLPSPTLPSKFYKGDGVILDQLNKIHALHIDETKGFLYAWGGELFGGAAKIFDLKPDPYNPVYVGKYDQLGYVHDGYVDNDTMYSGHIYAGQFAIVNMADKSAPELINTQTTPGAFTHNTWLANDRRTIFATDEVNNSFLSAWDVSDPTDIKLLDKIQSNPGSNSMVHNTYIRDNWAVTSWYKDGFTIVDITRPDNLVQVGNHDTYPSEQGGGSAGCWGVYHNFPSGTIIASNINVGGAGELWIVTPNYVRACYLEGKITDAITGNPLQGAQIQVVGTNPLLQESSATNGIYKTGQEAEGYYKVLVSKPGYQDFETFVYLQRGEVVVLDVPLFPNGLLHVSGTVIRHKDSLPVEGAKVWLYGGPNFASATTDAVGAFSIQNVAPGTYYVVASAPGIGIGILAGQTIVSDTSFWIELSIPHRRDAVQAVSRNGIPGEEGLFLENNFLKIRQNPFETETVLEYELAAEGGSLTLLNGLGQTLQTFTLSGTVGQLTLGDGLAAGVYFAVLKMGAEVLEVKKLVKK
ncbi:MAG: choice-of-anchor B family protein [Saprospiraceae bacterium]